MALDEQDYSEVKESPKETRGESGEADIARAGQVKTAEQKDSEQKQAELRKNYDSSSSTSLPRMDLSFDDGGALVAKFADKLFKVEAPQDGTPDAAAAKPGDAGHKAGGGGHAGDGGIRQGTTTVDRPADTRPQIDDAAYKKIQDDPKVQAAQDKMESKIDDLEKGLRPDDPKYKELEQFRKDREAFEARAASMHPPMSPEQVARTEEAILKILETKDGPGVMPEADRRTIAMQAMHHAAFPTSIDQGNHSTCNVTTQEARMFTKDPAAATEMIAEVATTGKYVYDKDSKPPKEITVDPESLKKHNDDLSTTNPPGDGVRSFDSQVFQVTAVNLGHELNPTTIGGKEFPAGSLEYRQRDKIPGLAPPDESGEVLVDKKTGEPIRVNTDTGNLVEKKDGKYIDTKTGNEVDEKHARPVTHPSLEDNQISPIYDKITKQAPEQGVFLANSDYTNDKTGRVTQFHNPEEMRTAIQEAKDAGKLPITIRVNGGQEPFLTDSGGGKAGGSDGPHVITITDIDDKGNITTDNQWGSGADFKKFTPEELFKATKSPQDHIKDLEKECAENAKTGNIDYSKELELLRMKRFGVQPAQVNDEQFRDQFVLLAKQSIQDAKAHGGQMDDTTRTELAAMLKQVQDDSPQNFANLKGRIGEGAVDHIIGKPRENSPKVFDVLPDGNFKDVGPLDPDKEIKDAAKEVSDSLHLWNQPDRLEKALANKSPGEIALIDAQFKKDHNGMSMEEYIKKETKADSTEQRRALALLHPETHMLEAMKSAKEVHDSLHIYNQPDRLAKALAGKDQDQIDTMNTAFKKEYGMSMEDYIKKETKAGSPEQEKALKLLHPDEKTSAAKAGDAGGAKPADSGGERAKDAGEKGADKAPDRPLEKNAEQVIQKLSDAKLSPEQEAQLRRDLADIEKLPPGQREKVLESLDKIAANEDHPADKIKLSGQQQGELVASLAHQIAHPESIVQGANNSAAAANMERIAAQSHPEVYADMVASLATQGEYKTAGGMMIHAETHGGALDPKSDAYGKRSYTSEVFQDAVTDLGAHMGNPPRAYRSLALDSADIHPRPPGVTPANDHGERLIDPANPKAIPEVFNGLKPEQQAKALEQLFPGDNYAHRPITTPAELEQAFKDNGAGPMKVAVDAGSGEHAMMITQIENGQVYYENPAGGKDHSYPNGDSVPVQAVVDGMKGGSQSALVRGDQSMAGGQQKVREGVTVVEPRPAPVPGPDLEKDARDIRKATEKDDLIDTGTDEDAIYKAMAGKTPAQTLELMKIYAKNNNGADLMADLRDELSDAEYAKVKDQLQDAKALEKLKDNPEVKKEHAELEKRARETMKEPELTQFLNNMDKLEGRAASLERQYQKELEAKGMSPEQAAKEAEKKAYDQVKDTYKNVEKLLEKNDAAAVKDPADRVLLAQQCMQHAGDPKSISQGNHSTCSVASMETRTYTNDPAQATRLVADMATKGEYTSNGKPPVTVRLDEKSLQKQGQSQKIPPNDNERDYSSQMFQVTAYNVALEVGNQSTKPPGQLRYEQGEFKPGGDPHPPPDDCGARLVDRSKQPPLELERDPGMHTPDLARAAKEISPDTSAGTVAIECSMDGDFRQIQRRVFLEGDLKANGIGDGKELDLKDPESLKKVHEAIDKKEGLDPEKRAELHRKVSELERDTSTIKDNTVVQVKSEQEMKDTLKKLKDEGKLPVIIMVDTGNEPFFTDSGGGSAGGSGGKHFVTVTDYDPDTGVAKMENQWGKSSSHDVTAKDLFEATQDPKYRLDSLQKEVDKGRGWFGDVNYSKEYELLHLKQQQGKISPEEYDKEIARLTVERYKEWKKHGSHPDDAQYKRESAQVSIMVAQLEKENPERAAKIKAAVKEGMKEVDA